MSIRFIGLYLIRNQKALFKTNLLFKVNYNF